MENRADFPSDGLVVWSVNRGGKGFKAYIVVALKRRQPVTESKFINKNPLFILFPCVIHQLELKSISEQKVENIFVTHHVVKPPVGHSFF